jgi:hypothetical protein
MPKKTLGRNHPLRKLARSMRYAAVEHGLRGDDEGGRSVCEEVTIVGPDGVERKKIVCHIEHDG